MKQRFLISIFLIFALVLPVFADEELMLPLTMPSVAANGYGGHHVAYTDNVFSLFVNPGAIARTNQGSVLTIAPTVYNPYFMLSLIDPVIGLVTESMDMQEAFGSMINSLSVDNGKLAIGLELNELPLSIASVKNGFGWGLWDRIFLNVNIVGTQLQADAYIDVMLPIGFAFKVLDLDILGRMTVDVGATIKPYARIKESINENALNLVSGGGLPDMKAPLIVGGGLDAGAMFRWNWFLPGEIRAGLTFNDIFSHGQVVMNLLDDSDPSDKIYKVPFSMNFGVAYELKLGSFMSLAVMADLHNMFSDQDDYLNVRNAALDFSMGAQLSLFNNFLQARIGMNEMLPSIGAGIHLGAFHIDAAYYGKELGYEPGMFPVAVLELSISIRPEAKNPQDAIWNQKAIIGGN